MDNLRDNNRNREIVRLHVEERLTLSGIARILGLSRQRIHQLVRREGVDPTMTRLIFSESRRHARESRQCTCGKSFQVLPHSTQRSCSRRCVGTAQRTYTDGELIAALRSLALDLGYTPSQHAINAGSPTPAHMTYVNRFGSLSAAQELAGLVPNRPGYNKPIEGAPGNATESEEER